MKSFSVVLSTIFGLAAAAPQAFQRRQTTTNGSSTTSTQTTTTASASSSSTCFPCLGNTESTRDQWCDHNINDDYYSIVPCTGVTREYWFELTETTGSPDGVSRMLQTVNGGDNVVVHVTNKLPSDSGNGTSLHFHGVRQNYTNQADGVTSVTQCPTAPGETYTYKWRATQYGSSWYHSHFGFQAWEGIFGGIVINGPASADYDVDLGNLFIQDWDHSTTDELYIQSQTQGQIASLTGLINGTNVYGNDGDDSQVGSRCETTFEANSSYLIRLVNVAIDTHFKFMIDNHTMTVIASDFVSIEPYETTSLSIGMGQRYDIVVTADQGDIASDFWMRAIPQSSCSDNDNSDNIKGIVHYGSSTSTPTTSGYDIVDECVDETDLIPVVSRTVGDSTTSVTELVSVGANAANYFKWELNETSYLVNWDDPVLLDVYNNQSSSSNATNLIELPNKGEWVYLLITESGLPIAHPIHLHGHDFFVLGAGAGTYDSSTVSLNLTNPARRDVALLQASGWLMIAFETDNPGAWIMHCHIGWHTLEGFALQFLEMESDILSTIDADDLTGTCDAWSTYATSDNLVQGAGGLEDSGLRRLRR